MDLRSHQQSAFGDRMLVTMSNLRMSTVLWSIFQPNCATTPANLGLQTSLQQQGHKIFPLEEREFLAAESITPDTDIISAVQPKDLSLYFTKAKFLLAPRNRNLFLFTGETWTSESASKLIKEHPPTINGKDGPTSILAWCFSLFPDFQLNQSNSPR